MSRELPAHTGLVQSRAGRRREIGGLYEQWDWGLPRFDAGPHRQCGWASTSWSSWSLEGVAVYDCRLGGAEPLRRPGLVLTRPSPARVEEYRRQRFAGDRRSLSWRHHQRDVRALRDERGGLVTYDCSQSRSRPKWSARICRGSCRSHRPYGNVPMVTLADEEFVWAPADRGALAAVAPSDDRSVGFLLERGGGSRTGGPARRPDLPARCSVGQRISMIAHRGFDVIVQCVTRPSGAW